MLLTGFQTQRGRAVFDMVNDASRELSGDDALRMYDEVDMIVNFAGVDDCALDEASEHILCDIIDLIVSTYLDRANAPS